jgi:hypothetical protein
MSKIAFIVDIDDSICASSRKIKPADRVCTAYCTKDGQADGFMNKDQSALWNMMVEKGPVLALTARTPEAFSRVQLPFYPLAGVDFGARLIRDGHEDRLWLEQSIVLAKRTNASLEAAFVELNELLSNHDKAQIRLDWYEIEGYGLYICAKKINQDHSALENVASLMERIQLHTHSDLSVKRNGNNVVLSPGWLNKDRAARVMVSELHSKNYTVVGVGDSASDWDFLKCCDFVLSPSHSQIGKSTLSNVPTNL